MPEYHWHIGTRPLDLTGKEYDWRITNGITKRNGDAFVIKLTTNFGPHDPVGNAEHQLNNLLMKDGSHINKYVVKFNHLTTQVHGYGGGALHHIFYNGLLDCIKDKIAHIAPLLTQAVLIWGIILQAVWQLLQHLLLILHWQRNEPSLPILLYS
ncbi:hypothetical protein ID866_11736 [Astraeus odoratus]|nr:hypothetical protein ID866_11736 [Astraeus odoratus]